MSAATSLHNPQCAPRLPSIKEQRLESLFIGLFAGVFGLAYFTYGKKQGRPVAMFCGVALCIYPYLIDNPWALAAVGGALLVAPFLVEL